MSEQKPGNKTDEFFHKFMINFALWVFPLFGVAYGVRYILFAGENNAYHKVIIYILAVLLIGVCALAIKARFDLAALRRSAAKELPTVCIAAGALAFLINLILYRDGDIGNTRGMWAGGIVILWGIALYRYYKTRGDLFTD